MKNAIDPILNKPISSERAAIVSKLVNLKDRINADCDGSKGCQAYQDVMLIEAVINQFNGVDTMNWIKTNEQLPINGKGQIEEVDILMLGHGWATPLQGRYTYFPSGHTRWTLYDTVNDCFQEWSLVPHYWLKIVRPDDCQ